MKKFFALLMALVMALSLVACGGGEEAPAEEEVNPKLEELMAAHEAAKAANAEFTAFVEEYIDQLDPSLLDVCKDVEASLADGDETIAQLESGELEIDDATYDELITATKDMEAWAIDSMAQLVGVEEEAPVEEVTAADVLSTYTWELVGGTLGEELWDEATYAQVLESMGGSLYYNFELDGTVTQILGSGSAVSGTYEAQSDVELLLDFNGTTMIAAVAGDETGYELYISDMDYASTMILVPVEG